MSALGIIAAGRPSVRRVQGGFTLIEVLIALLVLAVGLLGFALLQTMNVRFTQSANYRTQATNLADTLLDQARADRVNVASYAGSYTATTTAADCVPAIGTTSATQFRKLWSCQLGQMLGAGATANVAYASNVMTVAVSWNDDRWNPKRKDDQTFQVVSQL